jgi:hypothetical protein
MLPDGAGPPVPEVVASEPTCIEAVSPLNSIQIPMEETLTLRVREETEEGPVAIAEASGEAGFTPDQVAAWERDFGRYPDGHPKKSLARLGLASYRSSLEEPRRVAAASPAVPDRGPACEEGRAPISPTPQATAPAPPAPPGHVETVDLIRRLANPCGPEAVEAAARRLATRLGDEHSTTYYAAQCARVRAGELPAKVLVGAFRQASSPTLRWRGSAFVAFVKEHAPPGSAQKPTPGARHHSSPGADCKRFLPASVASLQCLREVIP